MVAINQRIPNFLGGVSQQPDTIKFPGQVRTCDNFVPDVTFGLQKRPSGEFVGKLANANNTGYWYEILRDGDEKYVVQMTASASYSGTKPIRIWNLSTGVEVNLTNSNGDSLFAYMQQTGTTKPYAIQTIQDYTIITNPQQTISTTGTTDTPLNSGDYAFARLDTIAYNTEYVMYTGATAPTAVNYYRVTALSVTKAVNSPAGNSQTGNTWDSEHDDSRYAGLDQFSFTDAACENIEGHVTVNAASYVDSNTANYDSDGAGQSTDFLGYTQNYRIRYTAQVTLKNGGLIKVTSEATALAKSHTVTIEGVNYTVNVDAVEPVETYEGYNLYGNGGSAPAVADKIAFYRTPKNPDQGRLSMTIILQNLFSSINTNLHNVTAEVIGSGLYLYGSAAPTVNFLGGAVNEQMNVIGNTAQDVSRLPSQCKHGYIAQIANSDNIEADNYYVKFIADNGTQGSGKWEECVRPHNFSSGSDPMVKGLDPAKMPHALVNNRTTPESFTFKKLDKTTADADSNDNYWKYREVGEDETNPFPSFNGKEIQKIFFHRNRLGLIADEQVVMSRPGDYFNFFIVSAISTSDDNPIDITVSDIKPAFINHILPVQKGVMMFSDNGQFLLFTESDIFSPKTARLKKVSSYETDSDIQPLDMGTSIMFTSKLSAHTRAFEATILDDDVPPQILEQTRVVPEFVPKDITTSTNSANLGMVTFAKAGDSTKKLYNYKYYDSGERRDQSAWYTWTLSHVMYHMFYTEGCLYTVIKHGNDYILNRHEFVADHENALRDIDAGEDGLERKLPMCLDNATGTALADWSYNATTDKTTIALPYTPSTLMTLVITNGNLDNHAATGTVLKAELNTTNGAIFSGNLAGAGDTNLEGVIGYPYTSTLELPTYYPVLGENQFDINGDLRISGMNFELGVASPMEFHLESIYSDIDDYIHEYTAIGSDIEDTFGSNPVKVQQSIRVPIQRKNKKYNLTLKSNYAFPMSLISASWDGIYNQRRHVRR